ncbi:J domain-containing protein [Natronosalvus halobius]|uniref:J domain-containing protein n=1 Tax=Natronosalvus halobius TaxID=2953746 RepID=UPI00209F91B5|nr:J domain-containing protein [Natronosalvus halobius]USZ72592.1 J domain-containing protein [Natronosalvus halobius]
MQRSPIVLLVAALFAGMTALLVIGSFVSRSPIPFVVAVPLGATAYFMYYHGSGKLLERLRRREVRGRQRQRERTRRARGDRDHGSFGAGPRARGGPRTRAEREARFGAGIGGARTEPGPGTGASSTAWRDGGPRERVSASNGPTTAEARSVLGVDPTADQATIKRAYRERVKDVHPDRGGDEAEFKRVTAAYDRLRE